MNIFKLTKNAHESVVSRIFLVFSEKLYSTTLMEKSAFEHEDNARTMIGRI